MTNRLGFWLALTALLVGAASVVWKVGPFPRVRAKGPNVVVYLVDTLPSGHLGYEVK